MYSEQTTQTVLIGVAISIAGNVIISLALNTQKLAHSRISQRTSSPSSSAASQPSSPPTETTRLLAASPTTGSDGSGSSTPAATAAAADSNPWADAPSLSSSKLNKREEPSEGMGADASESGGFLRSKLWWTGLLLMALGESGNFASYAFAPASLIAPLGSCALLANIGFAKLLLSEQFKHQDVFGVLVCCLGAVTVVLASRDSSVALGPEELVQAVSQLAFIVYSSVVAGVSLGLAVLSELGHSSRYMLIDILLCSGLGGFTVLSTKAISTLLTTHPALFLHSFLPYPFLFVLVVTALGQLRYLNRALAQFDSKQVVPTQFVFFSLAVISGSGVLYRDFDDVDPWRFTLFAVGLLTTFYGVWLLVPSPTSSSFFPSLPQVSQPTAPPSPSNSPLTIPNPSLSNSPHPHTALPLPSPSRHSSGIITGPAILLPPPPLSTTRPRSMSRGLSAGHILISSGQSFERPSPVVVVPAALPSSSGRRSLLGEVGEALIEEEEAEAATSAAGSTTHGEAPWGRAAGSRRSAGSRRMSNASGIV